MRTLLLIGVLLGVAALALLINGLRTGDPAGQRRRFRVAFVILLASLAFDVAAVVG